MAEVVAVESNDDVSKVLEDLLKATEEEFALQEKIRESELKEQAELDKQLKVEEEKSADLVEQSTDLESERSEVLDEILLSLDKLNENILLTGASNVVEVSFSDKQLTQIKQKETEYLDLISIYFSVFVGLILGYIGVKGAFSLWR